jgi:DNA-binding beta-propeller fold protein YncE/cytochrome c peroxidase
MGFGGGFGGGTGFGGGVPSGGGMGFGGGVPSGGGMGFGGGVPMGGGAFSLPPILTGLPQGQPFEAGALRATAIAPIPGTRSLVAVTQDADVLFRLDTSTVAQRIPLPPGSLPWAVAVTRDGHYVWVALRGLGQLARVDLLLQQVDLQVDVGADPVGVALSPSGATAVVTTFGERSVALVDTVQLTVRHVAVGDHPRGVAITDNGDQVDGDESAFITLFYGQPTAEASDVGRTGTVVELSLGTGLVVRRISLGALNSMVGQCSPNQLYAIALGSGRAYVAHQCALPGLPQNATTLVNASVSVIDLATGVEVSTLAPGGSIVVALFGAPTDLLVSRFDGSLSMLSQGTNVVVTVQQPLFQAAAELRAMGAGPAGYAMGPPLPDLAGNGALDGVPTSLFESHGELFVLDGSGRRVSVFFPFVQSPIMSARFELPPTSGPTLAQRAGRRFFYTALGRWSQGGTVSCASCHPDGLSDNLTWAFPTGPRQTPALDSAYSNLDPTFHRAQNWTANFDEISDAEGVTRNVMGGVGAITVLDGGFEVPYSLSVGRNTPVGMARNDGLSGSTTALVNEVSTVKDWNDIVEWLKTVRTPSASHQLDQTAALRGRTVFVRGGCDRCHGGLKWTVSRVPYVPSVAKNGSAAGDNGALPVAWGLRTQLRNGPALWLPSLNTDLIKVAPEVVNGVTIGPERITCVLRNVGTFNAADPLERKPTGDMAQGAMGYNPPSLLGVATTAPYFHNGSARTLAEVFDARYAQHTQAGSDGTFTPTAADLADLVTFLESIDGAMPPLPVPPQADICGSY